jgi:hypothetical protein
MVLNPNRRPIPSWIVKLTPVAKFILESGNIEMDPIGQRLDVGSLDKKQGIIRSLLSAQDICEIALREMDTTLPNVTHGYRSIDGGHRKRAIFEFFTNKFKTGSDTYCFVDGKTYEVSNQYYSELPAEVKEFFNSYKLRFVVYDKSMTDEQAGETFRLRNLSTNVNHQEMLNSYEDNLVAKFVREISRTIRQCKNVPHQIFASSINSKGETVPVYFQTAPSRLSHDEFVARLLCLIVKDKGLTTSSHDEIRDMYVDYGHPENGIWVKDSSLARKHQNELKNALDFLLHYAEVRKRLTNYAGITNLEAVMLSRLYIYLCSQYGKYPSQWSISDMDTFYNYFKVTFNSFVGKNPTGRRLEIAYEGTGKTKAEMMKKHLAVFDVEFKILNTVNWMLAEFEMENITPEMMTIVVKDKNRSIDRNQREDLWLKQGRKCFISEKDLAFEDAVAAHVVAHSEGGMTNADNIVIVHKELNNKMGSLNVHDYKRMYQENLNKSSNNLEEVVLS